jgi:hypothetical protein
MDLLPKLNSGNILEVTLAANFTQYKSTFTLNFDGQVPIQIRRSEEIILKE